MSAQLIAVLEFERQGVLVRPGDELEIADAAEAASMLASGFARLSGDAEPRDNIRGRFVPTARV